MRVILRTQLELGIDQSTQKREERLRLIEVEESWSLVHHGIVADAATFLMAWYIVSIELPLDALRLWNEEIFDHRSRKKLLHVEEFVLFPALAMKSVDIARRDPPFNRFQNWTHGQRDHSLIVKVASGLSSLLPQFQGALRTGALTTSTSDGVFNSKTSSFIPTFACGDENSNVETLPLSS